MTSDPHAALYRAGGTVSVLNSILFFNNNSRQQIAGTVVATFSDIQGGFAGEGNIGFNPIFDDQLAIVPPSPGIDAGDPDSAYNDVFPPGLGDSRNDLGYTGGPNGVLTVPEPDSWLYTAGAVLALACLARRGRGLPRES